MHWGSWPGMEFSSQRETVLIQRALALTVQAAHLIASNTNRAKTAVLEFRCARQHSEDSYKCEFVQNPWMACL